MYTIELTESQFTNLSLLLDTLIEKERAAMSSIDDEIAWRLDPTPDSFDRAQLYCCKIRLRYLDELRSVVRKSYPDNQSVT